DAVSTPAAKELPMKQILSGVAAAVLFLAAGAAHAECLNLGVRVIANPGNGVEGVSAPPGSLGSRFLNVGDVISSINRKLLKSPADFDAALCPSPFPVHWSFVIWQPDNKQFVQVEFDVSGTGGRFALQNLRLRRVAGP